MNPFNRWRVPLRIARRQARRAWVRSLVVVLMIALPVAGVAAVDVVFRTAYRAVDQFGRQEIGQADAIVRVFEPGEASDTDLFYDVSSLELTTFGAPLIGNEAAARLSAALDPDATTTPISRGRISVTDLAGSRPDADDGGAGDDGEADSSSLSVVEIDLDSPLTAGIAELGSGRWPAADDEVAVTSALAEARGLAEGDTLDLADHGPVTVVGVATGRGSEELLVARPGAVLTPTTMTWQYWLVDEPGDIEWPRALELAREDFAVRSRRVLDQPPDPAELEGSVQVVGGDSPAGPLALVGLVSSMIILEVILLAGPAFAVGARRSERSLAVLGANGATPRLLRRVVLAEGMLLGGVSAVVGVGLGIVLALVLIPPLEAALGSELGPASLESVDLIVIGSFAALSALAASVVPAFGAARRTVVEVLSKPADRSRVNPWWPVIGGIGLALGLAATVYGSGRGIDGLLPITGGALLTVVSAIFLLPSAVELLGRVSTHLPLPFRYALRDGARNRSRTVPAVAASMATVAGAVALSVAITSYERAAELDYRPQLRAGQATVYSPAASDEDWSALTAAANRVAPDGRVRAVVSVRDENAGVPVTVAAADRPDQPLGGRKVDLTQVAVDDGSLVAAVGLGLDDDQVARARSVLADGGAVVLVEAPVAGDRLAVTAVDDQATRADTDTDTDDPAGGAGRTIEVPAAFLVTDHPGADVVLAPAVVEELGLPTGVTDLVITDAELTRADGDRLEDEVDARSTMAGSYVETGYRRSQEAFWVQLGLSGLAGALMVGGTLAATLLALADARSDLATLAAVGASPRLRRRIAAAYALAIGGLGAVLGTVVGLIPGWAVSRPLTLTDFDRLDGPVLALPWGTLGALMVVLPAAVALGVALTTRSRLPLDAHRAQMAR